MKIAVEGCAHGELDKIYECLEVLQKKENLKIDLLICCGDFQSTRNHLDLKCMAVPRKYQHMQSFYKYYSGEKVAPILTIFIGGNHEASNYLQELPYGGWVAPNIYYLGYCGIVNFGGIRIGGLSGIFKGHDYNKGRFEIPPYRNDTVRSVYHIRNLDVFRLKQIKTPIDIFLSHDWPRGIWKYGDKDSLVRQKPFFQNDIDNNQLGSPPAEELLSSLKPSYWFAAHLHCKFAALVPHENEKEGTQKITKFLALDKCLPRRKFLQVVDIPDALSETYSLKYDLEWLCVLHHTNHLTSTRPSNNYLPGPGSTERWEFTPTAEEKDFVLRKMGADLNIPLNFAKTTFAHEETSSYEHQVCAMLNPQTVEFCERLGIDDPIALIIEKGDVPFKNFSNMSTPEKNCDISSASLDESELSTYSSLDDSYQFSPSLKDLQDLTPSPLSRSRFGLKLPPPKFELSEGVDDLQDSIISDSSPATEKSPIRDSSAAEVDDEKNKVSVKKFKRRNQEIYAAEDEETI